MTDMLERSARIIDGLEPMSMHGLMSGSQGELHEVADGVALVDAFSNVIAFSTERGLTLFDVSHELFAPTVLQSIRRWSAERVDTAVYTHGHVDHVTGAKVFEAEAAEHRSGRINVVAHTAVPQRFDRYELTNGYNGYINMRQFRLPEPAFPSDFRYPDTTYELDHDLSVGGVDFTLHHARGETDDHTWAYVPSHNAICVGDLFIWQFPNAGNPQKVQRYAWDWAVALRAMAATNSSLLLPAHGPAISGADYVERVLLDTAEALESLHTQVLMLMNSGARLSDVVHNVRLPDHLAGKPYLQPTYDEPEFVVRNLWRLYGGWYDGNPANLKPAADITLAQHTASISGGANGLADLAERLASADDLRSACHFAELAVLAEPDNAHAHQVRAHIYETRRDQEQSFMASGIYRSAARDSRQRLTELGAGSDH